LWLFLQFREKGRVAKKVTGPATMWGGGGPLTLTAHKNLINQTSKERGMGENKGERIIPSIKRGGKYDAGGG